ncbi:MAG: hypothetical protein ACREHF_07155 [Rhizomicrobium sp.]
MTGKAEESEKGRQKKQKRLLDPDQPRITVTNSGGEYAGRHPTPDEDGPDIVQPGGTSTSNETTRSQ